MFQIELLFHSCISLYSSPNVFLNLGLWHLYNCSLHTCESFLLNVLTNVFLNLVFLQLHNHKVRTCMVFLLYVNNYVFFQMLHLIKSFIRVLAKIWLFTSVSAYDSLQTMPWITFKFTMWTLVRLLTCMCIHVFIFCSVLRIFTELIFIWFIITIKGFFRFFWRARTVIISFFTLSWCIITYLCIIMYLCMYLSIHFIIMCLCFIYHGNCWIINHRWSTCKFMFLQ